MTNPHPQSEESEILVGPTIRKRGAYHFKVTVWTPDGGVHKLCIDDVPEESGKKLIDHLEAILLGPEA